MANEKDDVLKANQGAPAADIPDLKKKEKERKKGGAAWSGGGGGAGSFTGATGGTVARAAASAAVGAAEAGEAGGLFAGLSQFFAGLMATVAGKIAVVAAAMLLMAGAGALAYSLLHGGAAGGAGGGVGGLSLGPISDSMKIRSGDGDMMGVNGRGELAFGGAKAPAPAAPAPTADKAPADQKAATDATDHNQPVPDASSARQDVLAHNLSGAKLSSSLGGDFGSKNIFAGGSGSNAPKFNAGLSQLSGTGGKPGTKGNLNAMSKTPHGSVSAMDITRARSSQAIGQLKMARGMSVVGANSAGEAAASAANGAFDQQGVTGGSLNTIGAPAGISDGTTGGASSGSGAPDTTSMPSATSAPLSTTSTDPQLQNAMSQIQQMAQQAAQLQKEGMMMIVAGVALIAIGSQCLPWGAILIGIGGMLVGIGVMMEQMASQLANMANQLGSMVSQQVGGNQGQIVQDCTSQALTGDTSPCNSSTSTQTTQTFNSSQSNGLNQQSTVGTATPTLGGTGGVTTNGTTTGGTTH